MEIYVVAAIAIYALFRIYRDEKAKDEERFKNELIASLMVVKIQEEQLERERVFFNEMVEIKKQLDFDSSHYYENKTKKVNFP